MLGALILMGILLGSGITLVGLQSRRVGGQVQGILETARVSERRMRQLLSLVYYGENYPQGRVKVYLFSYGREPVAIQRFWMGGTEVRPISAIDVASGEPLENLTVPPNVLAEFTFPWVENRSELVLMTRLGAVFSWRLG